MHDSYFSQHILIKLKFEYKLTIGNDLLPELDGLIAVRDKIIIFYFIQKLIIIWLFQSLSYSKHFTMELQYFDKYYLTYLTGIQLNYFSAQFVKYRKVYNLSHLASTTFVGNRHWNAPSNNGWDCIVLKNSVKGFLKRSMKRIRTNGLKKSNNWR